jgi:hypothetical protein
MAWLGQATFLVERASHVLRCVFVVALVFVYGGWIRGELMRMVRKPSPHPMQPNRRRQVNPTALLLLAQLASQIERLPYKPPVTLGLVVRTHL